MNGDGHVDFFTRSGFVLGSGRFDDTFNEAPSSTSTLNPLLAAKIVDWDGDGDLDSFELNNAAYLNNGAATFDGQALDIPAPPAGMFYSPVEALGDFNGDGLRDALVSLYDSGGSYYPEFVESRLLVGQFSGSFADAGAAAAPLLRVASPTFPWIVADADADGDVDVLGSDGFYPNQGTGFFNALVPAFDGNVIATADVEGDGDLDFLTFCDMPGVLPDEWFIWRQQGGGVFVEELLNVPLIANVRSEFAFGDFDADGDPYLARTADLGNAVDIYENRGTSFALAHSFRSTGPTSFGPVEVPTVFDADRDGRLDLLVIREDGSAFERNVVALYRCTDPATFDFTLDAEWWIENVERLLDADGDGDLDAFSDKRVLGIAIDGPEAGSVRQYGEATAGTGAAKPLLGVAGSMTQGSSSELRLVRGLGGAPALYGIGSNQTALADFPFAGLTLYFEPFIYLANVTLDGPVGLGGAGQFSLPFNVSPTFAGLTFYHQFMLLDAASPSLLVQSNGLETVFGL